MASFLVKSVVSWGKIIFVPIQKSTPSLPVMSFLLLNEEERGDIFPWRAVCIDLEIDASGDSKPEAWESLEKSLTMYISMEKEAAGGSIVEAAKFITKAALSESRQKTELFALYRQAKMEYFIRDIESDTNAISVAKEQQGKKKVEKNLLKIKVEQGSIQPDFVELNGNILEKVSTTYVFSPQKTAVSEQSLSKATKTKFVKTFGSDLFWLPLVSPPHDKIIPSRQLWESIDLNFLEKSRNPLISALEN